jgi:hypothetical protein
MAIQNAIKGKLIEDESFPEGKLYRHVIDL